VFETAADLIGDRPAILIMDEFSHILAGNLTGGTVRDKISHKHLILIFWWLIGR